MDPESRERFERIDLALSQHDEMIIAHDKSLTAIKNLLKTGIIQSFTNRANLPVHHG